ncbi:MAG: rRNA pseudouridine synthase [Bdellovibrionaceae bacterium]|nr:rRNA pseudouridine synthase [Pseudobdellovibrionaceae bacterium]MBX3034285.1 rRNA pseudouridine synthase [Pseudobdellovibrionaceae bacterium]
MSDDNKIRLSKLMAEKGLCSRREADDFISRGLVYVNGEKIDQLGTKVSPDARITLDTRALETQKSLVTIILNKPIGYVSAQPEDDKTPAIRLITDANQYRPNETRRLKMGDLKGLAVTGRLDIDSQGLLLFTQDGRLAKRIIGENSNVEKEYIVRVRGHLSPENLQLLRHGLSLDGKALKPAQVDWINEDQLRFILREGKKRQIRRMCESVDLKVIGLKRVRLGRLRLGDLPEGQWRFLREGEEI